MAKHPFGEPEFSFVPPDLPKFPPLDKDWIAEAWAFWVADREKYLRTEYERWLRRQEELHDLAVKLYGPPKPVEDEKALEDELRGYLDGLEPAELEPLPQLMGSNPSRFPPYDGSAGTATGRGGFNTLNTTGNDPVNAIIGARAMSFWPGGHAWAETGSLAVEFMPFSRTVTVTANIFASGRGANIVLPGFGWAQAFCAAQVSVFIARPGFFQVLRSRVPVYDLSTGIALHISDISGLGFSPSLTFPVRANDVIVITADAVQSCAAGGAFTTGISRYFLGVSLLTCT